MSFACRLLNKNLWKTTSPLITIKLPTSPECEYWKVQPKPFKTFSKCYVRGEYAFDSDGIDWPSSLNRRRRRRANRHMDDEVDTTSDDDQVTCNSTATASTSADGDDNQRQPHETSFPLKPPSKRLLRSILDDSATFEPSAEDDQSDLWSTPRYPASTKNIAKSRLQGRHGPAQRPGLDPQTVTVILFPGQGAQYPGMAKSLLGYPNVRRMFEVSSEILGYDLLDVCLKGSREELSRTVYCQPATVVASLAALEKLKDESPHAVENCTATAGFSVGEITSLIFANALNFEDGIKLVRIRAEAMEAASQMTPGGMMSVFFGAAGRVGFACKTAKEWCIQQGIEDPQCTVANYLFPGCKVLSGHKEALNFIADNAKDFSIDRYKRLRVSGAFHSQLMLPAMDVMVQAMKRIRVADPLITVYSNVDGRPYRNVAHIQRLLPKQLCEPVRWEQVQHALYERPVGSGFPQTYECGPGRSLQTVLQKVNAKAYARSHVIDV